MALYEQGVRMLQHHNYAKAAELLAHIATAYPDERELVERARLYLGLCQRHLKPLTAEPENTLQRLYAATLALNAGDGARAIGYLDRVLADEPDNDQALYMLAVAHSEQGDSGLAIRYLQQAIAANAENRSLARFDPDLESLRAHDAVLALLDAKGRPHGTRHEL